MRPTAPHSPCSTAAHPTPGIAARPLCALLIDVEPVTAELIALWLAAEGWQMRTDQQAGDAAALIVIELAFPRQRDRQRLQALTEVWPGVPVIVLSPTFFAHVPAQGDVARQLGVAAVVATPVARDALVAAVRAVLPGST